MSNVLGLDESCVTLVSEGLDYADGLCLLFSSGAHLSEKTT